MKRLFSSLSFYFFIILFHSYSFPLWAENAESLIDEERIEKALDEFYLTLTDDEKIEQLFLVNIEGNEKFYPVEKCSEIPSLVKNNPQLKNKALVPGGILLFNYNVASSAEKVFSFTKSIKEFYKDENLVLPYISVDQEGGFVNRFKNITSVFTSQENVSAKLNPMQAYEYYKLQARQLKLLGVDLNLSPVAEPLTETNKAFLLSRSFGRVPETCVYTLAEVEAFHSENLSCVLKHFPGNSNTDPHTGLPFLDCTEAELFNTYLLPFKFSLSSRPEGILMSHIQVKNNDEKNPSCLSSYWISEVLKTKYEYTGLIISDDIFMAALEKNGFPPEVACVKAIEAGCDVIMLSEKRFARAAQYLLSYAEKNPDFKKLLALASKNVLREKLNQGLLVYSEKENAVTKKVQIQNEFSSKEFYDARDEGNLFYTKFFK